MSSIRYEFIMSQIKHIRDIKENEKTKISLVFYEGCQGPCIFKVCKERDLSEVYYALLEVKHPNLAVIYDCVFENGNTYVLEEYIHGKTLAEVLTVKGPFSEDETVRIINEVCKGLEVLHQQMPPIIHNDIKASNIMLCADGSIKLFDFDISRIYKIGSSRNTKLMGTYEYAAPEHYGFGQSEPCTDIYSLGVTMHEMLTGVGLSHDHSMTYEGSLSGIIRKCVEIDRKKRYASAVFLKNDLEKFEKKAIAVWKIVLVIFCSLVLVIATGLFLRDSSANEKETQEGVGTQDMDIEEVTEDKSETEEMVESEKIEETEDSDNQEETKEEKPGSEENPETEEKVDEEENLSSQEKPESETVENIPSKQPSVPSEMESEEVPKKEVKVVHQIQDTFYAMDVWNDGTFLYMEKASGAYYLRSSDGKEKRLDIPRVAYGAQLECNPYTDQMYLLVFAYENEYIYSVTRDLEIELIKVDESQRSISVSFFSYGRMVHGSKLLNSHDWSFVSQYSNFGSHKIIKDRHYAMDVMTTSNKVEHFFFELNEACKILKEFSMEDAGIKIFDYYGNGTIYHNSKAIYFMGQKENKQYMFCFDGEKFIPIMCIGDYGINGGFGYEGLCVTDTVIRCYSTRDKAIVEFEIE